MKTALWMGVGVAVVVGLVVLGLGVGWALWGQHLWAAEPATFAPMGTGAMRNDRCSSWGYDEDQGHSDRGLVGPESCPPWEDTSAEGADAGSSGNLSIEEAHEAVEAYLDSRNYGDLEVSEVMEFEHNFYAMVQEPSMRIGAMELLVDKNTGAVGPEMGPNMMWNTQYGMHDGGMMDRSREANTISPDEAVRIASRWLETSRPGVVVEDHADPFYGYYTLHTMKDGRIEGMLSVHGRTGQVWYHTWHGEFVQMLEHEDDD